MRIQGRYYDGQTSQVYSAEVEIHHEYLTLNWTAAGQTQSLRVKIAESKLEPLLGETNRVINLHKGARFEFSQFSGHGIDKFFGSRNKNWLHELEKNISLVVILSLSMLLFIASLYKWGIPAAALWLAPRLPDRFTQTVSESSIQFLNNSKLIAPTAIEEEWLTPIHEKLKSVADQVIDRPIEFKFHSSRIGPNAFALPNGHIIILDDFLKQATSDDQIIAVALHELGHIHHHHGMQMFIQDTFLTVLVFMMIGTVDISQLPLIVMMNAYSRDFERQADDYAVEKLIALNKSPVALAEAFQILRQKHKNDVELEWLSTHPDIDERIDKIKSKYKNKND